MLTVAYMGGGGCQKWPKTCLRNLRMALVYLLAVCRLLHIVVVLVYVCNIMRVLTCQGCSNFFLE